VAERISWNEQIAGASATVNFEGPPTSRSVLWAGVVASGCAAFLGYMIWFAPHKTPLAPWLRLVPVPLVIAGLLLLVRGMPGAHAGRITVENGRFRMVVMGGLGLDVDVGLADIDYFAGSGVDDQSIERPSSVSPEWDRFRVYVYTRDRRRLTLATFGEAQPAVFMAQRLDSLVERMRYRQVKAS